ncbi:hypothetical protein [Nitratireductor pacificus]|uniref:Uncharacterized protein n=1 Tax=Nitratireductor pacificus pht-3B TaxID=391937 RepID=K2LLV1_9HYPH|nr:hypothetical protein [Nitratireductor pacificus]EKF18739.1 hypothetical protein NA2_11165 [Nitratireductor pacificus pht-3B]
MGEYVRGFLEIANDLLGPNLVIVVVIALLAGMAAGLKLGGAMKTFLVTAAVALYFGSMNWVAFPYPYDDARPDWQVAGFSYTPDAQTILTDDAQLQDYSLQRRNAELVSIFGGDVEMVWSQRSLFHAGLLFQFIFAFCAFALGVLLETVGERGYKLLSK